jgi:sodium-dependent dicarboxylate transporter 2/3/5
MLSRTRVGLGSGLLVAVVIVFLPLPDGMSEAGRRTAAVTALMAVWWISEAIPIAATALLPIFVFPLLGISSTRDACAPYADPTNLFFLGGLMIAAAVERWGLQRRLALHVMNRLGGSPRQLVLGFMTATAMISMWTSNAATTMMMLPIALAVLEHFEARDLDACAGFAPALMLSVAYAASIGGVGTLVGTPPNVIFAGAFARLFPAAPPIGFAQWMMVGTPLVIVMTPLAWLFLTRVAFRVPATVAGSDDAVLRRSLAELGSMTTPERRILIVFATTALLWVFRADLDIGLTTLPGWTRLLPNPRAVDDTCCPRASPGPACSATTGRSACPGACWCCSAVASRSPPPSSPRGSPPGSPIDSASSAPCRPLSSCSPSPPCSWCSPSSPSTRRSPR